MAHLIAIERRLSPVSVQLLFVFSAVCFSMVSMSNFPDGIVKYIKWICGTFGPAYQTWTKWLPLTLPSIFCLCCHKPTNVSHKMCARTLFFLKQIKMRNERSQDRPVLIFKCWDSWKTDSSTYSNATTPKQLGSVLWNTLAATDKYALFAVKIYGERIIKATRSLNCSRINHLRAILIRSALRINTCSGLGALSCIRSWFKM